MSIGELIDKATILNIKSIKIKSIKIKVHKKVKNIKLVLKEIIKEQLIIETEFYALYKTLHRVNRRLWEIEDELRLFY